MNTKLYFAYFCHSRFLSIGKYIYITILLYVCICLKLKLVSNFMFIIILLLIQNTDISILQGSKNRLFSLFLKYKHHIIKFIISINTYVTDKIENIRAYLGIWATTTVLFSNDRNDSQRVHNHLSRISMAIFIKTPNDKMTNSSSASCWYSACGARILNRFSLYFSIWNFRNSFTTEFIKIYYNKLTKCKHYIDEKQNDIVAIIL